MAEYIKREDILKILHAARYNCAYNREDLMSNGTLDVYKWLKTKIEKLPAADVVPRELYQRALSDVVTLSVERKRGEWIHRTGNRDECSNCGARYYQDLKEPFMNFCPNCGAEMREES